MIIMAVVLGQEGMFAACHIPPCDPYCVVLFMDHWFSYLLSLIVTLSINILQILKCLQLSLVNMHVYCYCNSYYAL